MNPSMPMLQMVYDFAPINMKITKENRDFTRFAVNVRVKKLIGLVMCNYWRSVCDIWINK